ncbi:MAG: alpha/beta fold hydrolase, partial [Acidimicrobiia bacterium]
MQREPRPIRFDAGGMDLAALRWGPDDGPLALCLHGFPDTAWTWRHLGPALAGAGWHVVAPFLRGYAPSGLAPDGAYGVGALVHDVIDAHRRFARRGRSVLVGHDWGAITAYAVGSYRPELFDRIVTLAVPPVGPLFRALASPARLPSALGQVASSWYTAFHQIPRLPELVLPRLVPRLWATWSPGYDARADLEH